VILKGSHVQQLSGHTLVRGARVERLAVPDEASHMNARGKLARGAIIVIGWTVLVSIGMIIALGVRSDGVNYSNRVADIGFRVWLVGVAFIVVEYVDHYLPQAKARAWVVWVSLRFIQLVLLLLATFLVVAWLKA
jgi:hypothetical protein